MIFAEMNKQLIDFNKKVLNTGFQMLSEATKQSEEMTRLALRNADYMPEESKKAIEELYRNGQKMMSDFKQTTEQMLNVDISSKEAPEALLGVYEKACNNALAQAEILQSQNAQHTVKLKNMLPKEGLLVTKFYEETVNNGLDYVKGTIKNGYALAHNLMESTREKPAQTAK